MKKLVYHINVFILIFFLSTCDNKEKMLIEMGNDFVNKIELYKKSTGRLPSTLAEVGIVIKDEANPPVYYERKDSSHFIIWFGTTLGESKIFYSDSRRWEDFYREMK